MDGKTAKKVGATDIHVRFSDVQKSYDGETLVVKNLNLDIARGEFLTMLGPSGSGKTTWTPRFTGIFGLTTSDDLRNLMRKALTGGYWLLGPTSSAGWWGGFDDFGVKRTQFAADARQIG